MKAFHNDPAVKEKYLSRIKAHQIADNIIQGTGWDKKHQKGCAIGCTLENYSHKQYPIELGIPEVIARVEDMIFEGLSVEDAKIWPARFLDAVPVGKDLTMIWPKLCIWLLEGFLENKYLVNEEVRNILKDTIVIYTNYSTGNINALDARAALDALDARAALDALDARKLFWKKCVVN